jgi:hypothetical protein
MCCCALAARWLGHTQPTCTGRGAAGIIWRLLPSSCRVHALLLLLLRSSEAGGTAGQPASAIVGQVSAKQRSATAAAGAAAAVECCRS